MSENRTNLMRYKSGKMIQAFGKQRYIANLGHGLYPDTEKHKVKFFIDCIKSL